MADPAEGGGSEQDDVSFLRTVSTLLTTNKEDYTIKTCLDYAILVNTPSYLSIVICISNPQQQHFKAFNLYFKKNMTRQRLRKIKLIGKYLYIINELCPLITVGPMLFRKIFLLLFNLLGNSLLPFPVPMQSFVAVELELGNFILPDLPR